MLLNQKKSPVASTIKEMENNQQRINSGLKVRKVSLQGKKKGELGSMWTWGRDFFFMSFLSSLSTHVISQHPASALALVTLSMLLSVAAFGLGLLLRTMLQVSRRRLSIYPTMIIVTIACSVWGGARALWFRFILNPEDIFNIYSVQPQIIYSWFLGGLSYGFIAFGMAWFLYTFYAVMGWSKRTPFIAAIFFGILANIVA